MLIADEDEAALRGLHAVLAELGHEVTPYAVSVADAVELIAKDDPQVAIVVVHNDDEHALALIGEAVEYASGPVIAQLPDADVDFLVARGRARASPPTSSRWTRSRCRARSRSRCAATARRSSLHEKVDQLEGALERRGVIERAKGILMERHGVGERQAFELLRDHSRTTGRRVVEVAQAVLDGHALLPKRP